MPDWRQVNLPDSLGWLFGEVFKVGVVVRVVDRVNAAFTEISKAVEHKANQIVHEVAHFFGLMRNILLGPPEQHGEHGEHEGDALLSDGHQVRRVGVEPSRPQPCKPEPCP